MANRYWVGGTGTWNSSSNAHWSSIAPASAGSTGNAPQSVPSTTDDVIFDANASSGAYVVTVTDNFTIVSLTTNVANGLTLDFTTPTIAPGTWTIGAWQNFGSNARTFNLGAGTFNITGPGANLWGWNPTTNVTLNAGTSTLIFGAAANVGARPINLGSTALTYNNIVVAPSLTNGTMTVTVVAGITVASMTIQAPNYVTFSTVPFVTGALTFTGGNSSNWTTIASATPGSANAVVSPGSAVTGSWIMTRQITFNTSPVSFTNHINLGLTTLTAGSTTSPPVYDTGGGGGGVIGVIGS